MIKLVYGPLFIVNILSHRRPAAPLKFTI